MDNKNLFITGVTGLIGSSIILDLSKKYDKIFCLIRNLDNIKHLRNINNLEFVTGDITNKSSYEQYIMKCCHVYHIAGVIKHSILYKKELFDINFLGTKNILESSLKYDIKKVLYLSSAGIFHSMNDRIVSEDSPLLEDGFINYYCYTKYLAHKQVEEFIKKGLNIISLMPVSIYDENSPLFNELIGYIIDKKYFLKKLIDKQIDLVSLNNVKKVILNEDCLLENNQSYLLSDDTITIRELIEIIEKYLNIKIKIYNIQAPFIRFVLKILNIYSWLFKKDIFFNKENFNFLNGYLKTKNTKINNVIKLDNGSFRRVILKIILNN